MKHILLPPTQQTGYDKRLGVFSATMMVVGGIIGAGIFLNPANVAQRVVAPHLILGVWILGGVIALLGAFCFAELGARLPKAGGSYVYLRQAFGRFPAFLYSWTLLLVIATGAIAAVAVTFSSYTVSLLGLPPRYIVPLAVGAIVFLSAVNYVGVVPGAITQNVFTVLKLLPLAALAVAGVVLTRGAPAAGPEMGAVPPLFGALAAGLVPVLFAYGGWQQLNFIAEELVEPERIIPKALFWGVAIVVTTYLLVNVAYLRTLTAGGLAASTAPAADTMQELLGPNGRRLIAAGIAISTFGFLDLVILVSPRVYRALAEDRLFFRRLADLHPRFRTPAAALLLQAAWAIGLTLTNSYGELLDWVVFGDWIFFGATAATLFVYRSRERKEGVDGRGGYRLPLYPLIPILFVAAAAYTVVGSVLSNPGNALRGTGLMLLGVPVYLFWSWRARWEAAEG